MFLMRRSLLFRSRARGDSSLAAVVAYPVHCRIGYGLFVNVVNGRGVYVVYGSVVVKLPVLPTSPFETLAVVTVAVTNPAVESHLGTPVTVVEHERIAIPAPIRGSPEQAGFGSRYPRAWHPVIIVISVSPVARSPDVTVAGNRRLLIYRQFGWFKRY
jgi:hypothetical protein